MCSTIILHNNNKFAAVTANNRSCVAAVQRTKTVTVHLKLHCLERLAALLLIMSYGRNSGFLNTPSFFMGRNMRSFLTLFGPTSCLL